MKVKSVAATDYRHVHALEECGITRRAIGDTFACQALFARNAENQARNAEFATGGLCDNLIRRYAGAEAALLQHLVGQEAAGAARVNAVTAVANRGWIVGQAGHDVELALERIERLRDGGQVELGV